MKRILSVMLIFVLCFPLGACRHIPVPSPRDEQAGVEIVTPKPATKTTPKPTAQPTSTPQPTPEPTPTPTPEPLPEIEIVNEQLILFTDGNTYVYLCEFINPCDFAVKISDVSIDIEDAEGNLLSVTNYVYTMPRVIPPGGTGYVYESVVNALFDDDVDITAVANAVLHYSVEKSTHTPLPVELVEVSMGIKRGYPNILGRLKNVGDTDLGYVYVTLPIYSADGSLQAVMNTYVDIPAGQEVSFENRVMADNDLDYSGSYLGDPIIYPLF